MADIIENIEIDRDTVSSEDIEKLFSKKYNLIAETAVSLKKTYINKLDITKSLDIAVSLLDNTIEIYKLTNTSLTRVCRLSGHQKSLTDLVYSPKEDYLLYSIGHDGIKLWDTRSSGTCVQQYKNEDNEIRPYESMDVSCTGRVLCAGSQLVKDDAYIVFWDQRQLEPLGGYWNSHTDDVTQVKFHKSKQEVLVTGSSDGLVNVFNIMEPTEDEALTYSINTEGSVERLAWLSSEQVACVSQSNDLALCDVATGDVGKSYSREKIAKSIKRSRADDCYLVDAFAAADGPMALAGSHGDHGDVLRSVALSGKKLQPGSNFSKNTQIVRCCRYDADRDVLVTAGESGLVSVWGTAEAAQPGPPSSGLVQKLGSVKLHDKRHKPY